MRTAFSILLFLSLFNLPLQLWAPTRSDITGQSLSDLTSQSAAIAAAMKQQGLEIAAMQQQQQELLAAQRQANLRAAEIEKWNDAVAEIKIKTASALEKVNEQYNPTISDLISKQVNFQQTLSNLWVKKTETDQIHAHELAKQLFQPKDPWRKLDGKVYNAKDTDWLQFTGRILEIRPNGILIHGKFGRPLDEAEWYESDYYVDNLPNRIYSFADNDEISTADKCVAHLDIGSSTYVYTNTTIDLRVHTVRRLDYGTIVDTPPQDLANKWTFQLSNSSNGDTTFTKQIIETEKQKSNVDSKLAQLQSEYSEKCAAINTECDAEIKDLPNVFAKQYRQKKEEEKEARDAKILAFDEAQADKGDAYGLMRMGERYRDGEGVPKDLFKARDYLTKAADAGSPTAADELSKLDQNLATSSDTSTNGIH